MSGDAAQGLRWENGVPVSAAFDDPYFSREDGLAETRHVFLRGCALPERWAGCERFSIAELGFGTGLNFCAALALWRETAKPGAVLDFTSFELYPMTAAEIARALDPWPELAPERDDLVRCWTGERGTVSLDGARLTLVCGDARQTVPAWQGMAQAWFLDGFAPSRNPQMWEPDLLDAVAAHSAEDAHAATYSVAGTVRRGLEAAGFDLERLPGYGRKREMLRAVRTIRR